MKQTLRKTEFRKTTTFVLFTAFVLFLLYLDAAQGQQAATVAAEVGFAGR